MDTFKNFPYQTHMKNVATILIMISLILVQGIATRTGLLSKLDKMAAIELAQLENKPEPIRFNQCCKPEKATFKTKTSRCFADISLANKSIENNTFELVSQHQPVPQAHIYCKTSAVIFRPPIV